MIFYDIINESYFDCGGADFGGCGAGTLKPSCRSSRFGFVVSSGMSIASFHRRMAMDNLILIITALAPGFAGIAALKLLNGDATEITIQKSTLKYFLFGGVSLLLADALMGLNGPVSRTLAHQPLHYIDLLLPMILAVILAAFWHTIGETKVIKLANWINHKAGRNNIFLANTMLERMMNDGKPHFVEIRLPDGEIQQGYVADVIVHEKTIMLQPEPEWTHSYKREDTRKMIDLASGIVITEYTYR